MPAPNIATISQTTINWSNDTPFNGYIVMVLAFPSGYTHATLANQNPTQRIGDHIKVKITNGIPDGTVRVPYTTSLLPPGCKWTFWWYDATGTLIHTPTNTTTELLAVTTATITL